MTLSRLLSFSLPALLVITQSLSICPMAARADAMPDHSAHAADCCPSADRHEGSHHDSTSPRECCAGCVTILQGNVEPPRIAKARSDEQSPAPVARVAAPAVRPSHDVVVAWALSHPDESGFPRTPEWLHVSLLI